MITADDVFAWMPDIAGRDRSNDETALMDEILDAVVDKIDAVCMPWPADSGDGEPIRPAAVELAIRMQAARLWKRRSTPEGVAGFGEFGVIRVTRLDSDVEALIAPWPESGVS